MNNLSRRLKPTRPPQALGWCPTVQPPRAGHPRITNLVPTFSIAILVIASCFFSGSAAIASHPYHVSLAEVAWNESTGNFEVALCVWPADLEIALSQQEGESIDLDSSEHLDSQLKKYISSRFRLLPVSSVEEVAKQKLGFQSDLRWIGHEINSKKAWLYFELPGDRNIENWKIENRVFFELNEDQFNQLQLTVFKKTRSVGLVTSKSTFQFSTKQ